MGIEWTLQGVDAVSSARNAAVLMCGRVVFEGGLDFERVVGRFAEVMGADQFAASRRQDSTEDGRLLLRTDSSLHHRAMLRVAA
jgi:hypothetical protein